MANMAITFFRLHELLDLIWTWIYKFIFLALDIYGYSFYYISYNLERFYLVNPYIFNFMYLFKHNSCNRYVVIGSSLWFMNLSHALQSSFSLHYNTPHLDVLTFPLTVSYPFSLTVLLRQPAPFCLLFSLLFFIYWFIYIFVNGVTCFCVRIYLSSLC